MKYSLAVATAVLLLAAPTWAQQGTSGSRHEMNAQDQQFLKEAAHGNFAEVQLGQLASQKAQHETVKEFGRWMASSHGLTNREMTTIVTRMHGVAPPSTLDQEALSMKQMLQNANGAQFDQAYLQAMVQDHQMDVRKYRQEAQQGQDFLVKSFAQNALPALQEHLKEAQDLQEDTSHSAQQGAGRAANATVQGSAGATQPTTVRYA